MRRILWAAAAALAAVAIASTASAAEAVVRSVLFYSPTCGHCHIVIDEALPVIFEDHGGAPDLLFDDTLADPAFYLATNGSFEVLLVNVGTVAGGDLYARSTQDQGIPEQMLGVPRLVVGDEYYVGSSDIPEALPRIIEDGLASGGIGWPDIEGIDAALAAVPGVPETTTTEAAATTTVPDTTTAVTDPSTTRPNPFEGLEPANPGSDAITGPPATTIGEKFRADLAGNILAVVVLAGMLASLAGVVWAVRRGRLGSPPDWVIPVLAVAGVVVAVYLTYVETSGNDAVCGPVGNCNAVQESKFALLFGVIPVGLVGLAGYAVVVGGWAAARFASRPWSDWARLALAAGALPGVAFSIYLTFLEPFVIGATCIWCLSSAVIVTALFWLSAGPGWAALQRLRS